MPVSSFEVAHEDVFNFIGVLKIVRRQDVALNMGKDDLNLIQPGRMDRQPVDLDPEGQSQALDPLFDLLGRMRGTIVQDQMQDADLLAPETAEEHMEEGLKFFTEPFSVKTAGQGFAGVDQKGGEQLDGAFTLVAVADQEGSSRSRRPGTARRLAGLNRGLLVRADHDVTDGSQLSGTLVEPQDGDGLFQEPGIGRLLPTAELPGFDVIGTQPAPDRGGRNA